MTDFEAIRLDNVTVQVGRRKILDSVCVGVPPGGRISVLGRSGSGKTTLLRVVCGLEHNTRSGRVYLDGTLATEGNRLLVMPHERGAAMVFQDLALWPHMTAQGQLAFAVSGHRDSGSESDRGQRIVRTLNAVGLADRARARPFELSGGERQRLALARALITAPRYLLLDEPFSSLDLPLKREMIELVLSLHGQHGFTMVHVTHDIQEALRIADCIVVLEAGRVVWQGPGPKLGEQREGPLRDLQTALEWWRRNTCEHDGEAAGQ